MAWSDPTDTFDENVQPQFPVVGRFCPDPEIFRSLMAITHDKKDRVRAILKDVCCGCLETPHKQLADFLPEGGHHSIHHPELRAKLKHSKVPNLVGEHCFADLDFSLFKRGSASLHHHSTVSVLKRHKAVSTVVGRRSEEEQRSMLELSAKKAAALSLRHRGDERSADYISGVHHLGEIFVYVTFLFYSTMEAVRLHLHGWCMLCMFLLSHSLMYDMNVRNVLVCVMECMCARTRCWFIRPSERVSGSGVRAH